MGSLRVGNDWATSLSCIGERNGNPLQCSCLENPRDGGAWCAAVYSVAQSWTQLNRLSSSSRSCIPARVACGKWLPRWMLWERPLLGLFCWPLHVHSVAFFTILYTVGLTHVGRINRRLHLLASSWLCQWEELLIGDGKKEKMRMREVFLSSIFARP